MENLVEDYKKMSLRQMAEKYGVSAMTIKKRLNKLGVDTSYKKSMRPPLLNDKSLLKKQIDDGKSFSDIAKSVGVDKRTVEAALNRKNEEEIYYYNWRKHFKSSQQCSKWLLKFGFKHPRYDDSELVKFLHNMLKVEPTFNANHNSQHTTNFIKNFSEHFYYSTHKGYNCVPDAWSKGNNIVLKKAVKMMWEHNKNCNIFNLINVIARHFRDFATVSIFKPWVASYIYNKYLPNGGVVVDPCMGWGGRLLGCLEKNISYHGYDLNPNAIESHRNLRKFLGGRLGEVSFTNADSSLIEFPKCDLVFTSPPYDDTEHYHGIDSSKTITKPILNNIFGSDNRLIVLNLPKRQEDLCHACAVEHGYRLQERLEMKTASFMGREKTHEPILVYRK